MLLSIVNNFPNSKFFDKDDKDLTEKPTSSGEGEWDRRQQEPHTQISNGNL